MAAGLCLSAVFSSELEDEGRRRATQKHIIDSLFTSETLALLGCNGSIHYLSDKLPLASAVVMACSKKCYQDRFVCVAMCLFMCVQLCLCGLFLATVFPLCHSLFLAVLCPALSWFLAAPIGKFKGVRSHRGPRKKNKKTKTKKRSGRSVCQCAKHLGTYDQSHSSLQAYSCR